MTISFNEAERKMKDHDKQLVGKMNNTKGTSTDMFSDLFIINIGSVKDDLNSKGDYAWGVWTPTIYGSLSSSHTAQIINHGSHWYRIGNMVTALFDIEITSWNASYSAESLLLKGLPYAFNHSRASTGMIDLIYGAKSTSSFVTLPVTMHDSADVFWIRRQLISSYGNLTFGMCEASFTLKGSVTYSV